MSSLLIGTLPQIRDRSKNPCCKNRKYRLLLKNRFEWFLEYNAVMICRQIGFFRICLTSEILCERINNIFKFIWGVFQESILRIIRETILENLLISYLPIETFRSRGSSSELHLSKIPESNQIFSSCFKIDASKIVPLKQYVWCLMQTSQIF